jgi:hypothetical protein
MLREDKVSLAEVAIRQPTTPTMSERGLPQDGPQAPRRHHVQRPGRDELIATLAPVLPRIRTRSTRVDCALLRL